MAAVADNILRRWLPPGVCLVVVLVLLVAGSISAPSVATATPRRPPTSRDVVSVAGYDFPTELTDGREARVIVSGRQNLVFRYVAGTALRDGTLTLDVPRGTWPDPLHANTDGIGGWPSEDGSVVVRPAIPPGAVPTAANRAPADSEACQGSDGGAISWTVSPRPSVQRIVVQHLECRPGQTIAVRIFGIRAPSRVGLYRFPSQVEDTSGRRRLTDALLRVVPVPRIRLDVRVPDSVDFGSTLPVLVRALRPDGRVDTGYRGGVALDSPDSDCIFEGSSLSGQVYDFTAADAGVHTFPISFGFFMERIGAHDVANGAQPGISNSFTVENTATNLVCPISFH